jgi:hypothetical protein
MTYPEALSNVGQALAWVFVAWLFLHYRYGGK